ncbi:MAG TPA: response regulator [Mucilaginibacter sp.]|jgi:CheY-like chemotaxis protein|nr:response regulator [Mucilaginibacter sp.]
MSNNVSFLNFPNNDASIRQTSPDHGRNRALYYALIFFASLAGLLISIYVQHTLLSIVTAFTVLFCTAIFFKYVVYRPMWTQVSHALLILATLVNFSNAYITFQSIDILNIQLILLAILFSFYMMGNEWGLFYSLLNLVPTLVFIILEYNNNYFNALRSGKVDLYELIISLIVDTVLIVIIQTAYHKSYFLNLMKTKSEANAVDLSKVLELTNKNEEILSEVNSEFTRTFESGRKIGQLFQREAGLRVLIAEDNAVNVVLIKKMLAKWDITPTIAGNGKEVIELLKSGSFDIVLMDIQMPVLNGFDAAIGIRKLADAKKASIPIIAVTAAALSSMKEQVLNSGMNDYLAKPFRPDDLMEKIHHLVAFS